MVGGNNRVWDVDDNHSPGLVLLMPACIRLTVMEVENLMQGLIKLAECQRWHEQCKFIHVECIHVC